MTLQEMADSVMAQLNLTAAGTEDRIKLALNAAYRKVSASIGLISSRRASDTQATVNGDADVVFDLEKLERVYITDGGRQSVLREATHDEVATRNIEYATTGRPRTFAIKRNGSATVTVTLEPIPDAVYAIHADGYEDATVLTDNDSPSFPADYHDALVYDVVRTELLKKEKPILAKQAEMDYRERVAELRYFLVKSNSLSIVQNSTKRANWASRVRIV